MASAFGLKFIINGKRQAHMYFKHKNLMKTLHFIKSPDHKTQFKNHGNKNTGDQSHAKTS